MNKRVKYAHEKHPPLLICRDFISCITFASLGELKSTFRHVHYVRIYIHIYILCQPAYQKEKHEPHFSFLFLLPPTSLWMFSVDVLSERCSLYALCFLAPTLMER
uniref:Uncharacterized protein n=1 Tax=Fundulus heteroclitus TaxID=8078 RepID=A0A146TRM3_FUNHE